MLNGSNYFSKENELKYFGSTQFKSFMDCEARTLAQIKGEYDRPKSTALLVGSYVDAYYEGTLKEFEETHPEILKRDGSLKSDYVQASEIIRRTEADKMFSKYMSGEKQVIMEAELFGHPFKIKIDSWHEDKAIVDLKVIKDFEPIYKDGLGRVSWHIAWGYDIQGAIYQAVVEKVTGKKLPFILAAVTKQKDASDIGLFQIPQYDLDSALKIVENMIDRFADIKAGVVEPVRCEKCAYCRATKKVKGIQTLEVDSE